MHMRVGVGVGVGRRAGGVRGRAPGVAEGLIVAVLATASLAAPDAPARSNAAQEIVGERTATTKTFRNPNGTYTKALYAGPVHFRDHGRWRDIDSSLVPAWQPLGGADPFGSA